MIQLHSPETIALIQHEQCGVYHNEFKFVDWQEECEILKQDLQYAKSQLKEEFPGIRVRGFVARFELDDVQSLDEVVPYSGHPAANRLSEFE